MFRPAYYKLIEECVSQIVLHKSGVDPDFRATRRFDIDVEPLIDHLVERGRIEDVNTTSSSVGEMISRICTVCLELFSFDAKLGSSNH